jgi:iron complex outermembrane receptor protein
LNKSLALNFLAILDFLFYLFAKILKGFILKISVNNFSSIRNNRRGRQMLKRLLPVVLYFSLIANFLMANLFAQTSTLRGIVTDSQTGEGLLGANIIVVSSKIKTGTASLSSGEFEIRNLPAGKYTITISYIGYERKVLKNIDLKAGEVVPLAIALVPVEIQVNPVTVTASRRPEKLLEAPSSITVLETRAIESRTALSATEHLKALPAVDIITGGLNQSRVVVRGFNDLFSGTLLSMVDYRITRIPAVHLNAFQLIPTSNEDVEQIEVVSGPASALYGPNSANGVMHVLTKSPFDSKGTKISVGGGERSVIIGTVRHAGTLNGKIGYKFSVQHYRGEDFESFDNFEQNARQAAIAAGADPDTLRIGARIFDIKSTAFDGRVDVRFTPDFTFIINGGFSRGDNIEMTNQGAAQALAASFNYLQGRLRYKNLFVQSYLNKINTGDTYFLRTGQTIINNSSLVVAQAQHSVQLGRRQSFIYGLDALFTRPNTEGTVNGLNEEHDNVNEYGAYLQSETKFSSRMRFVAAARVDDHNRIAGVNFSPRAALVFKPSPTDNLRFTFNRAFSTPTSDMLFADNLGGTQPTAAIDPLLVPFLGETILNVRALGTWPRGFTFNFGADNRPQMITPFGAYLASQGYIPSANSYLPPDVNVIWPALRDLIIAGAPPAFRDRLREILPPELSQPVPGIFKVLNTETGSYDPVDASFVRNHGPIKESTTTTFEVGYKSLFQNKLLTSVDVYHSRINDYIGPLRVANPNVFIDPNTFIPVLAADIAAKNNISLQEAEAFVRNFLMAEQFGQLPIGVISPVEVQNGTDIILTNTNLGDVSVTGFDVSLTYHFNTKWNLTGNYSFVNKDYFKSNDGYSDIALNAPKHKVGAILNYNNQQSGFFGNLRLRFVDAFPANSGVFVGTVDRYAIIDLNANYDLPFLNHTRVTLTVQNLMNNRHREFVGLPEIGRLTWVRLTQTL